MKKFLLWFLFVLVFTTALLIGTLALFYYSTDEPSLPNVTVTLEENTLVRTGYTWQEPVLFGVMHRSFSKIDYPTDTILRTTNSVSLSISDPTLLAAIKVQKDDKTYFEGNLEKFSNYSFTQSGTYLCTLTLTRSLSSKNGYGILQYDFFLKFNLQPDLVVSSEVLTQGDVLAVVVSNLPSTDTLIGKTELGPMHFLSLSDSSKICYLPIAYNREPGNYTISVTTDTFTKNTTVLIKAAEFARQDLTVPESTLGSTSQSATANSEYRSKIWPLYNIADDTIYWSGKFIKPVVGTITTEYGLRRYVNGGTVPERHSGIDIAAAEGTLVVAPAAGRVVFSGYLQLSGNTIVIEHGGGLKSFFFHMSKRYVETDSMVTQGQQIGAVGSTGYSTGPHLHYEAKIASQSVSPWPLFEGQGGLFYKK